MHLRCAARTHPGLRRSTNEDRFCVREDVGLFVVADGMGGHVAGEVAARLAVDTVEQFVAAPPAGRGRMWRRASGGAGEAGERLRAGFIEANRQIAARMERDAALRGMATTAVAVLVDDAGSALAHVGDSRAYRGRGDRLLRLTQDHSWVEEQMQAGRLTPAGARDHPWRNLVTRALSGAVDLVIDVATLPLASGDRVLLCSDGLSSVVSDATIGTVLGEADDLDAGCAELIRRANGQGGPDNITVVLIEVSP